MITQILTILRVLWARPAVQASFWLVVESVTMWLKDWLVTYVRAHMPRRAPASSTIHYTPGESRCDNRTIQRPPRRSTQSK